MMCFSSNKKGKVIVNKVHCFLVIVFFYVDVININIDVQNVFILV